MPVNISIFITNDKVDKSGWIVLNNIVVKNGSEIRRKGAK